MQIPRIPAVDGALSDTDPLQVVLALTNAPDPMLAQRIVQELVQAQLVACGHVAAAGCSIYRWEGRLERAEESAITLKTTAACVPAVLQRLRQLHPYQVPEFLVVPVMGASPEYLAWVRDQVQVNAQAPGE